MTQRLKEPLPFIPITSSYFSSCGTEFHLKSQFVGHVAKYGVLNQSAQTDAQSMVRFKRAFGDSWSNTWRYKETPMKIEQP